MGTDWTKALARAIREGKVPPERALDARPFLAPETSDDEAASHLGVTPTEVAALRRTDATEPSGAGPTPPPAGTHPDAAQAPSGDAGETHQPSSFPDADPAAAGTPPAAPSPPLRVTPASGTAEPIDVSPCSDRTIPESEFDREQGSAAPPATPPRIEPGMILFDRYEILARLGHGGMGEVFTARDRELKRTVALKTLLPAIATHPRSVERFVREAQAAARLRHPNIVQVHDVGSRLGLHYFTMDFIEGRTLEAARSEIAPKAFLEILRDVARALHAAHTAGIVHRDVKPLNILLDATGRPYVSDFGLAKEVTRSEAEQLTRPGAVIGTYEYLSPEQANAHEDRIGAWSDVWSLGVILYEHLAGRKPFSGESEYSLLAAIVEGDPEPPGRVAARAVPPRRVHRDIETICMTCLEKEPWRRYASAGELADDLERLLNDEPISRRPPSWLGWRVRRLRKRPRTLGALGAGALSLLLVAAWWVYAAWQAEAEWLLVYEGPRAGEKIEDNWVPAQGVAGEWEIDPQTNEIVGAARSEFALLTLARWIQNDVRLEYEVLQEREPASDISCFVASDLRGWQYFEPGGGQQVIGTGYFVGLGAEGNRVAKIQGIDYKEVMPKSPYVAVRGSKLWHRVKVERAGTRIRAWVTLAGESEGAPALDFNDASPLKERPSSAQAYCGLYLWENCNRYRNIRVRARGTDPAVTDSLAQVGRAGLEFDAGKYAQHRERLRRVLARRPLPPEVLAPMRNQVSETARLLACTVPTDETAAEVHLAFQVFDGQLYELTLYSRLLTQEQDEIVAALGRQRGPRRYAPDDEAANLDAFRAWVLMEAGRWPEALAAYERLPLAKRGPSSGICLLALGRRAEAIRHFQGDLAESEAQPSTTAEPRAVARAELAVRAAFIRAEDGDDAAAVALLSAAPTEEALRRVPLVRQLALLMAFRRRLPPPDWVREIPGPAGTQMALVECGLLAAWNGDLAAAGREWRRIAPPPTADDEKLDLPPGRLDAGPVTLKDVYWEKGVRRADRSFVLTLAGTGGSPGLTERHFEWWVPRTDRAWCRLALGVRAEVDGDLARAARHYRVCLSDGIGREFPYDWAEQSLRRVTTLGRAR